MGVSRALRADLDFWEFTCDDKSGGVVAEGFVSSGSSTLCFPYLTRRVDTDMPH